MSATVGKKVKFVKISLRDLEEAKSSSVWILNRTNPRGRICMTVADGLGGATVMNIATTWIPVDLTTQATKENLLKNPTFRRLVTKGAIWLISEEQAEQAMRDPDAQEEAKKVYSMMNDASDMDMLPEVKKVIDEKTGNISGFALNIVDSELSEQDALNSIRNQEGALSREDYEYIVRNSKLSKVKEYCASVLLDD
jgi:hypothetical protein